MAVLPKVYAYGLALMGALFVGVLLCIFMPSIEKMRILREKKAALQAENRRLEEAVRELQSRQERFLSDSDAVVRTAHEANMVRPDEVVFKFTTGTATVVENRIP